MTGLRAIIVSALICLGLPSLTASVYPQAGATYTELPPVTVYVRHASFSWAAFTLYGAIGLLLTFGVGYFITQNTKLVWNAPKSRFPTWGLFGAALLLGAWVLAWTRFSLATPIQVHTFTFIWFGWILTANGILLRRVGTAPIISERTWYLFSFLVSAIFWWCYEFLNRFVQNWVYIGITDFTATGYAFFSTLAFATVLPAVWVTHALIRSYLDETVSDTAQPSVTCSGITRLDQHLALIAMVLGLFSLLSLPLFPNYLFASVWVAPIFILHGLLTLTGTSTMLSNLLHGQSVRACTWAVAGLACGFLWELWNFYSLAKWEYLIPYVDRFKIFEMPILGYVGYLPFGVLCGMVLEAMLPNRKGSTV